MARTNQKTKTKKVTSSRISAATASERKSTTAAENSSGNFLNKLKFDFQENQTYINMVLGGLIVVVLGVLIFNYFNKPSGLVGPSQQIETDQLTNDVSKDNLPGKYTVKEGDTLYTIANNYYGDGFKYSLIADSNKLSDPNSLTAGQVLDIPKDETATETQATLGSETAQPSPSTQASSPSPVATPTEQLGTGGAINQTIWGEKITTSTYVVQQGDWLSKIAGRAYGDVYAFEKIAKANNIPDPNNIEPGTILRIPQ